MVQDSSIFNNEVVHDSFTRFVEGSWGGDWVGDAANLYVNGSAGVIRSTDGSYNTLELYDVVVQDVFVGSNYTIDALPTGSGLRHAVSVRRVQQGYEYRGTARIHPDGKLAATVYRITPDEETTIVPETLTGVVVKPGSNIYLRLNATGTDPTHIIFSINVDGDNAITQEVDDSANSLQFPGGVAIVSTLSSSATNTVNVLVDSVVVGYLAEDENVPTPPDVDIVVTPGMDIVDVINNAPENAVIGVDTGIYHISKTIVPRTGQVIVGAIDAVIDGSVKLTDWERAGSYWVTRDVLPNRYSSGGQCENDSENPCLWAEQLFQGDKHLTRVMSKNEVVSGKFYQNYDTNEVYIADEPNNINMASTRTAISSNASNVTLKGLTVQKFASLGQKGAIVAEGDGWTIEQNIIRWNHALGLYLTGSDGTTVINNTIVENGQLGIGNYNSDQTLFESNYIARNNTDGFWVLDWESGGFKGTYSKFVVRRNVFIDNNGVGVWGDIDNRDVVIEHNLILNNGSDGIRYEISYDGTIDGNIVVGNGLYEGRGFSTSIYSGAGITSNASNNVRITNNIVAHNLNGIGLQGRDRGSGEYGEWVLVDNVVEGNTVVLARPTTEWGENSTGLVQNMGDNGYFNNQRGIKFDNNNYYLDSLDNNRFAWDNTYMDATEWQENGNDPNGTFNVLTPSSGSNIFDL